MLRQVLRLYTSRCAPTVTNTYSNKPWFSPTASTTRKEPSTAKVVETEKDYLVRIQNDSDTFGAEPLKQPEMDPDDLKEEEYISQQPIQRLSTKQYADIIKELIRKKKIKEAIDVLEVRMLKEDRVKPESYIYNLLLGACGRVGYTKKAFSLYNEIKRRALDVHPGTYTALFNACANSPFPDDGLTSAKHLHGIMIEKRYEPNDTNYNAMIKAFGRCGDLVTAFALVDEMTAKKIGVKDDTLNFLLQACISDKEAGFRHALLVWRKFVEKGIQPSIYTYNLLLRAVRECGLGDLETTRDVIGRILPESDRFHALGDEVLQLDTGTNEDDLEFAAKLALTSTPIATKDQPSVDTRPNLMSEVPHLGNIITLKEVTAAEDRLLLLGGASSYLQNMLQHNCRPDIKTFSIMLECVPNTLTAENEMMDMMKKSKVKPDIAFFNMLIKRKSMRFDYEGARTIVDVLATYGHEPDLMTYGVLALGCKNKEEALVLVGEMKQASYRLNAEILGAMLQQACYHVNFPYVLELMELCITEEIKPNPKFMEHLDTFKKRCKTMYNDTEDRLGQSKSFQKFFQIFRMRYKTWLGQVKVEEEVHPWQQFREKTDTDVRHYKDTDVRFKARHRSLFRVKTSTKHLEVENNNSKYRPRFKKIS